MIFECVEGVLDFCLHVCTQSTKYAVHFMLVWICAPSDPTLALLCYKSGNMPFLGPYQLDEKKTGCYR